MSGYILTPEEQQRKDAGWPPYVMAEILQRTDPRVEVRANSTLNQHNGTEGNDTYSVTYHIGIPTENGKLKPIAEMHISYHQPHGKKGSVMVTASEIHQKLGINLHGKKSSVKFTTNPNGEFIGDPLAMPKHRMQAMVDTLELVRRMHQDQPTHARIAIFPTQGGRG